ncbi:translation elongation factor Ts [Candidatus Odyssella acanthamoebae]|uniref:Elongation factor Ts n=1 Tax=Candidatus Odyssella acanthamoebae TaxID=91604 RepID=A0A077ATE6_9PROT|nr:translation elongation factor Ts [Candidatus Paracaedibacter acanthamoebae]AIK96437.1 elongation factor Ts [Candidatus Paracaedibacter acanthamoebae]
MAEISAALVRELREKSGAGMMDCKKALTETNGNVEEAIDWLRKKGLAAAAKKAGRVAAEGLVGVATSGTKGAIVEINAETDFVARNEQFQSMVRNVTEIALADAHTDESLKSAKYDDAQTVDSEITRLIATIGENMSLRRTRSLSVPQGVISSYIHNATAPGLGKIGVLVALESAAPADKLNELGKKIAMHIAAANPAALTIEEVDPTALERERTVLIEQARATGRPEEIIQKMVEGRVRKFYEEVVLLEQTFVLDGQTKVADVVEQAGKEFGAPIQLTGYVKYTLGEGIEKEEADFAAEVAAQASGNR